jgi:hypothetical protein
MNLQSPWGRGKTVLDSNYLSKDEKEWLGNQVLNKTSTSKELADRFSLKSNTLRNYARSIKNNKQLNDGTGRLTKLTTERKAELEIFMKSSNYSIRTDSFKKKVNELAKLSSSDRNQSVSQVAPISRTCLKNLRNEMSMKQANAEATTTTRDLVNPELILNVDSKKIKDTSIQKRKLAAEKKINKEPKAKKIKTEKKENLIKNNKNNNDDDNNVNEDESSKNNVSDEDYDK